IFEVRVAVTYALHPSFGLAVTTLATNYGTWAAPFGAGFHPYLSTGGHPLSSVSVRAPASSRLTVDDNQLPIGRAPVQGTSFDLRDGLRLGDVRFDDAFADVTHVDGRATVTVT